MFSNYNNKTCMFGDGVRILSGATIYLMSVVSAN